MAAWYKTVRLSPKVEIVNIEKATDSSVWIGSRRRNRISEWECYFETLDDALTHLRTGLEDRVASLKRDMSVAQSALGEVKSQQKKTQRAA